MRQQSIEWNSVKPIAKIYSTGLQGNLFYIFVSFNLISMYFGNLKKFLEFILKRKSEKIIQE
jgi:hypothetical protein